MDEIKIAGGFVLGKRVKAKNLKSHKLDKYERYDVEWEVVTTKENCDLVLRILNGITGFESWNYGSLLFKGYEDHKDFVICAGTLNKWDSLALPPESWRTIRTIVSENLIVLNFLKGNVNG